MLKKDVQIGHTYISRVSGNYTAILVKGVCGHGFFAINRVTGREISLKGGGKLIREFNPNINYGELSYAHKYWKV